MNYVSVPKVVVIDQVASVADEEDEMHVE